MKKNIYLIVEHETDKVCNTFSSLDGAKTYYKWLSSLRDEYKLVKVKIRNKNSKVVIE